MKKIFISLLFLLVTSLSFAQQSQDSRKKTSKALEIGDKMPGYTFPSVIQYSQKTLNLNEFKGKLIVLDFWSTSCDACIAFFPHLQQLQDRFKDRLQVIAVNDLKRDNWDRINKSLAQFKKNTGYKIDYPFALFDSNLYNYFPHIGIPFEVLINGQGKIIAMTHAGEITEERIKAVLDGKNVSFYVRDDFFNTNIPLISYVNKNDKDGILASSSLMKYRRIPGQYVWGPQYNEKGQSIGRRLNSRLIDFYQAAYPSVFADAPQVKYETKDSIFVVDDYNPEPKLFIYDWITRPVDYDDSLFRRDLSEDLDKAFNFSLRRSKEVYPCMIIRANNNISKSYTRSEGSNQPDENVSTYKSATRNNIPVYGHNLSIDFVDVFNATFMATKYINESGLGSQKLDIDFPLGFDFSNKEKLISFLSSKGIDLTIEERELDCVIVSDKKPGDPTILN